MWDCQAFSDYLKVNLIYKRDQTGDMIFMQIK